MSSFNVRDGDRFVVSAFCSAPGQISVNSFQIEASVVGAVTVTTKDVATALDITLSPIFASIISNQCSYKGLAVRPYTLFLGPKPRTEYSFANTLVGGVAGKRLPAQCAVILNVASSLIGLRNQGRIYCPFPGGDSVDATNGEPTGGYLLDQAALGNFLTMGQLVNGAVGNITVSAGHYNTVDGFFHRFDRFWSTAAWATQKRRGDYGKPNYVQLH